MDLSQFTTEDLKALQSGDLTKMSTQGLQSLKGQQSAPSSPLSAFIDAFGKAMALPGKPEANLSALANHITSFLPGQPSAAEGEGQQAATAAANPSATQIGTGAGHLGEGALAAMAAGPFAGALTEGAPAAGALEGALTGAGSGAASAPEADRKSVV